MSSTELVRAPIAVPPALAGAGVTVTEDHGVRSVMIPEGLKQKYNIAQPVSEVTQADPDWSPRLVVVDLSDEQYHYNEQGKRSLTKVGILLLAHAAGIEVDVDRIPRDQLLDTEIGFKATASIRRSDGTLAHWTASKVADLVDEEEATKGTNEKWPVVKKHLAAKTETKAILRAVSLALQLKRGGYLANDMKKPFLIVGVSSTPSDPDVRRERVLAAAGEAYGRRALAPHDPEPQEPPVAPRELVTGEVVADVQPTTRAPDPEPEPDPTAPVAGEIPPDVHAAGEVVFDDSFKAEGHKVSAVQRPYLEHIALKYPFAPEQEPTVQACRVWLGWLNSQERAS